MAGEVAQAPPRGMLRKTQIPPYDEVVDRVWKQAFPVDLISSRTFERPLEWGVSDWSFSNHNEDCAAELAVVKALHERHGGEPLHAMCIASGGETATALAACAAVREVHAVDMVNGQVMLTRLRFEAMRHLSNVEYRTLFGLDVGSREQHAASQPARLEVYDKLREKLPPDCRDYFDGLRDKDVAFGVGISGKVEQWSNACHRKALQHCSNIGLYEEGLWREFEYLDTGVQYLQFPRAWMDVLAKQLDHSRNVQGVVRLANQYLKEASNGSSRGDDKVVAAAAHRLRANHFVQLFHTGALGCGSDLPDCYSLSVQSVLKEREASGAVKVKVEQANVLEAAVKDAATGSQHAPSFITLSNIFDFSPSTEAAVGQLAPLTAALAPGTAVMLRTTLTWRTTAQEILEGAGMAVDAGLTDMARVAERSPMFGNEGNIAVAVVPARAG